ncbi:uncharacterized protein EI97DRAFT_296624 [Westerdykella ornata]|uniref:Ubiquitin-conjugating enzyme E2-binding protein n=1 Tax=Westerdykella ornata TaxID=318751 RepID=A0A6A6JLZ3_WESOR|nr:uncharacterized protein EI97DRAFT_296624 [Westerdykella ornata]KAF2277527.1 hypothetical protein EI97DRAFT_296624 [Westerdykella ornata]
MLPGDLPESAFKELGVDLDKLRISTASHATARASPNLLHATPLSRDEPPPGAPSIVLYAEILLHIRTATLFGSLRTGKTHDTKARLSTDATCITVSYEGESATLRLPMKVKGGGSAVVEIPAEPPNKDISVRLEVEEREGSSFFTGAHSDERKANVVPWDAVSLNEMKTLSVLCRHCQSPVVGTGRVTEWRDLPNENWAEMMDFWHCHKPDEHHLHDHAHHETFSKKGYAAGSRLKAIQSIGFIDLASFLLSEQDCEGVQSGARSSDSPRNLLTCKACSHVLGVLDEQASGWRVWKWALSIGAAGPSLPSASPAHSAHTYSIQKWISARLLFLIENLGIRKFHVHADTDGASVPSLLIWVFTPDLLFSSSVPSHKEPRNDPTRAMKIFYQKKEWSPPKPGEAEPASVEEVSFPQELFDELHSALEESQQLLPVSARRFQGWDVGLLERFDVGEDNRARQHNNEQA